MKATRTHTYPKLPDKFKVRNEQPTPDEEVIYFWRLSSKTMQFFYSLVNAKTWTHLEVLIFLFISYFSA